MAKKIRCDKDGKIYYGTVLKNGSISEKDRIEITDDAISAVMMHLIQMEDFTKCGRAGYTIPSADTDGSVSLVLFATELYDFNISENFKKHAVKVPKKKHTTKKTIKNAEEKVDGTDKD